MTTVALVGFGLSGRYLQAPFFIANPNFRLKAVMTNSQDPQAIYPSVQKVPNIGAILADKDIDLVSICTPSDTHMSIAQQCILAGKHVLVEKPFAPTLDEAQKLLALAERHNRHVFVFQNRRFDSDFLTVKKVIQNGLLGDILSYEAHYNRFKPVLNTKKWKEVVAPANGILYDLGSHIIDQTIVLFGKPQSGWGQTFTQRPNSEIDDAFDIRLDYGKLKVKLSSSLMVREETPRYIIHGTKGSFIKYGIDVQEDHLKAGLTPTTPDFGIEPTNHWGAINADINGVHIQGKIETEQGNWAMLFQNIHDVLANNHAPFINVEDVLVQISIIEQMKRGV
jgi:scyllo-inositol 2-dehydrogenase (NADP+)